jgi:hypothetical protein
MDNQMEFSHKKNRFKEQTVKYDLRNVNPIYRKANRNRTSPLFNRDSKQQLRFSNQGQAMAPGRLIPNDTKKESILTPWWAHLRSGLVRDPTSKHRKAIGHAIWLYIYLLVVANWESGTLFRRISTIAAETGFNVRSIHRWLRILRKTGYINSSSNGRSVNISITKWRPISRKMKNSELIK